MKGEALRKALRRHRFDEFNADSFLEILKARGTLLARAERMIQQMAIGSAIPAALADELTQQQQALEGELQDALRATQEELADLAGTQRRVGGYGRTMQGGAGLQVDSRR